MLIDIHSHPILDCWREAMRGVAADPAAPLIKDGQQLPDWSPGRALEVMDANAITAMILSAPSGAAVAGAGGEAALARAMNDEIAAIVASHPRRFGAFAVLPLLDIDQALKETAYALDELGFDGVGLTSNTSGRYLGDEHFAPLFAELDRRGAVAFVHPDTPAFFGRIGLPFSSSILEFMFDTTRSVASMIYSGMRARYPGFAYIAPHAGGTVALLAERLGMVTRVMPTGYDRTLSPAEVAETLRTFHFDVTAATTPAALTGLLAMTTADRLLAGFDFPYMPSPTIAPARAALAESDLLSDADRAAIDAGNALRLLPRLRERLGAEMAGAPN